MNDHDIYSGLIRLHVLHHAAEGPIFGLWMIRELRHHGYKIGPGTLYPLLHRMEESGYLKSKSESIGGKQRRTYRITPRGRRALGAARQKIRELAGELLGSDRER